MQCVDCIKLSAAPTSTPAHASLIPQGFKTARGASSELTYRCKNCGTSWRRTVPAYGPDRLPHVWTAAWNAPPAKRVRWADHEAGACPIGSRKRWRLAWRSRLRITRKLVNALCDALCKFHAR